MTEPAEMTERFARLAARYRTDMFWNTKPTPEEVKAKIENLEYHKWKEEQHKREMQNVYVFLTEEGQ